MNLLLSVGLLLIVGYTAGWLLDKIGLPRIIGYILAGIVFSPHNFEFLDTEVLESTEPLLEISLSFIAFEIGGALKWSMIKKHEKEIVSITLLASLLPFLMITGGVLTLKWLFPTIIPFDSSDLLMLALLLGALASPTEPAATLAVMRQYKARGKVSNTILGVAALDDVLGILLFSLTIAILFIFNGGQSETIGNPLLNSLYEVTAAIIIGTIAGNIIDPAARFLQLKGEGQWVVLIFSLITFCVGISKTLQVDTLLATMIMGMVVVNKCSHQKLVFRILERYTEELIFLFFFLLSGLRLDISTIPQATTLVIAFVLLRAAGKYLGANMGARLVNAAPSIRKYTAWGLLPQGGVVIGLVLSIYPEHQFSNISELLLTISMAAMVIHELIGPLAAKHTLMKAGEIKAMGTTDQGEPS